MATSGNSEGTAGRLVSVIREARGLTQREVAARLGKSRGLVSLVEGGQRALRLEDVASWADALGVDGFKLEQLVRGSRGFLWEDQPGGGGEWVPYDLEITDESVAAGTWDAREAYMRATDRLAYLVNELSDPQHNREVARADDEGLWLTPRDVTFQLYISFPQALETAPEIVPQGTRNDVDQLVSQMTDQQLALTAAFVRGLLAQARSRVPDGSPAAPSDH